MSIDQSIQASYQTTETDEVVGVVFAVPDKWWGFEAEGREDHPGACVRERMVTQEFELLKGTGAENKTKYRRSELVVAVSETNGLQKLTLFSLKPRPFRKHRVRNLTPERVMGRLSDDDLNRLQSAMVRLFGAQG